MSKLLSKFLTLGEGKRLKQYREKVGMINNCEEEYADKNDAELRGIANRMRERIAMGESVDNLMIEAFALVREASRRSIGMRHYDVQLIGAMALHDGCIAEMKTGEGKTLVSTAAGFLNALDGSNVHIVTVNDYLAKRDSEWMGQIYNFLGMQVGLLQSGMSSHERKPAYMAAVTYGTNSEFGFDYLRDNTAMSKDGRVQRGHSFAVIDEVDSILIDEARTPLIISSQGLDAISRYERFAEAVLGLTEEDYSIDEKRRTIFATELGLKKIEERLSIDIYSDVTGQLANHLKQALTAQYLFNRDNQYVVVDGEVKIVDEFTGRVMEGRRYNEGLHQAIEAKERVKLQPENHTLATVTLQNYYRMYEKLSGMTGTAITEDSEFLEIYHLPVVPIPTNKPIARIDQPDLIYRTSDARNNAVVNEVKRRNEEGQPVLVGTSSVKESEQISLLLKRNGIKHEVLNAKNNEREAEIVAGAGRRGAVTISTNMAGRGTDILLGGSYKQLYEKAISVFHIDEQEASDWQKQHAKSEADYIIEREGYAVRQCGGLCVIGTQRHESRRIDNQLRGRAGRQGDPGVSQFFLSLDDPLIKRFGGDRLEAVANLMDKNSIPEDQPLQDELVSKVIDLAQRQVESMHFSTRKSVLEYDDVMDLQRKAVYSERNAVLDGKHILDIIDEIATDVVRQNVYARCQQSLASDDWDMESLDHWYESVTGDGSWSMRAVDHGEDVNVLADAILDRMLEIVKKKVDAFGVDQFRCICDSMMLNLLDLHWVDHLSDMDYTKKGISLRSLGHRDPLVEYKEEAYRSFELMVDSVYESLLQSILRIEPPNDQDLAISEAIEIIQGLEGSIPMDPSKMVLSGPNTPE
ncbi:preprotein translocase subunit SecA [Adlercreutzia equolifaciens]|uniref:preprotein translocase subunit SecA n=1 Tax=Adlercreutzia equolifaciens TaxID=446660 RepID=UPI0003897D17|nr:preprotein translocase subunit SecA [Adlercreutzia equolifaciens]RFT84232.1 preprotein translocase subunit SecA [Adlercreutzia equolifaciens]BAN76639.1 preprotein translocase SecA [Adlercreutzia equolifaciens DSM 19450]